MLSLGLQNEKKKTPSVKDKKKMHNGLHSKVNDDFNFRNLSVDVLFLFLFFFCLFDHVFLHRPLISEDQVLLIVVFQMMKGC